MATHHRKPEHHHPRPTREPEGNSGIAFVGILIAALLAGFVLYSIHQKPGPVVEAGGPAHTPPAADTNPVPITYPDPEGCVKCEEPTSQPSPVVPTETAETPPPKPYTPTPNPYIPPEHNPLVPHKDWGLPKQ